jgi:rhodanese-related sulfurtransferase
MGKAKSLIYFVVIFCGLLFSACNTNDEHAVSVEEFSKLINDENCLVVDVRTADEYLMGHIEGSATIDFYSPEFEHKFRFIDVNDCIVFYCNTGSRSGQAIHVLREELGFTNIVHLKGGLEEWKKAGNELVKE